jgi:hypothetical protein
MNKITGRIVALLLVLLITFGSFPAVFAADPTPEDTTADEISTVLEDAPTEPTEPTDPTESTEPEETTPPVTEENTQAVAFTEETVTTSPIYFDTGSVEDVPMLMAMDDGIMLAAASTITGTHYQRAIVWLTGSEKINFTYKGKDYSVNRLYTHGVIVDGKRYVAYCIDPGVDTTQASGGYTGSESAWSELDINTQSAVGLAILYGAPNKLSSTDKKTMLTYELATQIIVQEIILGFRSNVPPYNCTDSRMIDQMTYGSNSYFREISSQSQEYSSISGQRMDKAVLKQAYDTIAANLASHYVLPSFASRYNAAAKTYEMTKQSDGTYAVTLTDTNGVLANCTFKDGNGLTYSVSGNQLTIKASTTFDGTKSCALSGGAGVSKQVPNLEAETFMLWQSGSYQRIVSLQEPLNDPLPLYLNVKIPIQNGTAKIVKTTTNDGTLKGWTFTITDASGAKVGTYTTDDSGKIVVDLEPGTYTVQETNINDPYWYCDTAPQTVTVKAGETAKVTFKNQWIGKVKIIKTLANPEAGSVEGWIFTVKDSAGKTVGTYKTDNKGVITTDLEPGTYTVTEVLEEDSLWQCTTENPQTVTVKAGSTAEVTFTNALRPAKLQIQKVDDRGEPLAGAEFLLEWSTDGKTWKPVNYVNSAIPQVGSCTTTGVKDGKLVTGDNGLIEFAGLYPTLSYRLTETKAPDGYQLLSKPVFVGTLPADQDLSLGFTVTNIPVFKLPETGSNSLFLMLSGMLLCCIACVGVVSLPRKKEA